MRCGWSVWPANGFEPVARLSAAQAGGRYLQRMLGTGDNSLTAERLLGQQTIARAQPGAGNTVTVCTETYR